MDDSVVGATTIEGEIRDLESRYLPRQSPSHRNVVWQRAFGARVWDIRGKEYIDLTSGVVVAAAGHAHPRVVAAISEQASQLLNCYDAPHPLRGRLAKTLVELAGPPFEVVSLQSTGAEGIETALKIARAYTGHHEALAFTGGYHGKSLGALSVTMIPQMHERMGPLLPGVLRSEYAYCYRCPLKLTCSRRRAFRGLERSSSSRS
jgi:4-aminobutyrate aminotransferase-like enzyme